MPRVKAPPVKGQLGKSPARGSRAKAPTKEKDKRDAIDRVGKFVLALFVVRRVLALTYFAAFLSIAVQADGIFGCEGPFAPADGHLLAIAARFFPPGLFLQIFALCGAALAGTALVAVRWAEDAALAVFTTLWIAFAGCLALAPELYGTLEDRLVLEFGLVGILLALADARNPLGTAASRGALQIGRALAAWLLLRAVFVPVAEKLLGACPAWRDLIALKDAYQLAPFIQQPTCWLLWIAPEAAARALTSAKLFIDLASVLVFVPVRAISAPAAALQLFGFAISGLMANLGCTLFALTGVVFALLDDSFHATFWSEGLREAWGCPSDEPAEDGEDEDAGDEDKEPTQSPDSGANEKDPPEESELAIWLFFFYFLLCLMAAAAAAATSGSLPRLPGTAGLAVPACCALSTAGAVAVAAARSRRLLAGLLGLAVCGAGLLQASRDLQAEDLLPPQLASAAELFERVHVAHPLGHAAEASICPRADGRPDIYVQGAVLLKDSPVNSRGDKAIEWLDLSSRFLPNHVDENRPVVLQPYTPRLDARMFRFAQELADEVRDDNSTPPVVPMWLLRMCRQLLYREGAVVSLMAGPLGGLTATLYSKSVPDELYVESETPLPGLRINRRKVLLDEDIHTNKWWNTTDWEVIFQTTWGEKLEAAMQKLSDAECVRTTFAWHEVPMAEALLALVTASLMWRLFASG